HGATRELHPFPTRRSSDLGGLGPTEDDLTRESVAEALGLELRRDPDVLDLLAKRFASRNMKMSANNAKQADILAGAIVLPNSSGDRKSTRLNSSHVAISYA